MCVIFKNMNAEVVMDKNKGEWDITVSESFPLAQIGTDDFLTTVYVLQE